jgi:hypothetical protein
LEHRIEKAASAQKAESARVAAQLGGVGRIVEYKLRGGRRKHNCFCNSSRIHLHDGLVHRLPKLPPKAADHMQVDIDPTDGSRKTGATED